MQNMILTISLAAFTLAAACTQTGNDTTTEKPRAEPPSLAQPQDPPGEVALPGQDRPPLGDPPEIPLNDAPPGVVPLPYTEEGTGYDPRPAASFAHELCPKKANKH